MMMAGKGAMGFPQASGNVDPNVLKQQARNEQYKKICENIAPVIAQIIDERGGVGYLGDMNNDERLRKAIETFIPEGFSKKIKSIIELFPDFISYFDGGRVATAKAYEDGLVSMDGTFNEELIQQKRAELKASKPVAQKQNAPQLSKSSVGFDIDPTMTKTSVGAAAKKLRDMCNTGTDAELEQAYKEAIAVRHANSDKSVQELVNVCVMQISNQESPEAKGQGIMMSKLANRPEVQAFRPVYGNKFGKLIETHSHAFVVTKDERLGPIVAVNPSYVPNVENSHQAETFVVPAPYAEEHRFKGNGKKGAGKGGKNGKRARPY